MSDTGESTRRGLRERTQSPPESEQATIARSAPGASPYRLPIRLVPAKVAGALGLVALLFTLASLVGSWLQPVLGQVVELFGVGIDLSIPSWYSAILLLLASVLVATIAFAKKFGGDGRYMGHWAVLAVIFLYLSNDEMLRLHERMSGTLLQPALDSLGFEPTGVLSYPWIIVYAPLVAVFALAYLRFWLDLPSKIRLLFFAAGAVFVGGAIGAEMFNAWYDHTFGAGTIAGVMTHLEELMEMLGVVVFIYALMSYIGSHLNLEEVSIRFKPRA